MVIVYYMRKWVYEIDMTLKTFSIFFIWVVKGKNETRFSK